MLKHWHIVRIVNFLLALPTVPEYQLYCYKYNGKFRFEIGRLVWRKDRFRAKGKDSKGFCWWDINETDWIADSYGRVFIHGADYLRRKEETQ